MGLIPFSHIIICVNRTVFQEHFQAFPLAQGVKAGAYQGALGLSRGLELLNLCFQLGHHGHALLLAQGQSACGIQPLLPGLSFHLVKSGNLLHHRQGLGLLGIDRMGLVKIPSHLRRATRPADVPGLRRVRRRQFIKAP
jgi:hypothetical protein